MAACGFRELVITDGDVVVNLLNERSGFCLTDWRPAITEPKGGGVWADSALAEGRNLKLRKRQNVTEAFTLDVRSFNQDTLIRETQNLRRLLEKAASRWDTTWQNEPVWLEATGQGETNKRYGLIMNYSTPEDGYPYGVDFWGALSMSLIADFQLIIERKPAWWAEQPGTGTAIEISAVETFNGRNLGNVDSTGTREPTTAREVYISNKRNIANLTHVFVDDGGVFGANLLDAALPYNLLPAAPAIGDAVYFGIQTLVADSGPFCSLVFDIGTAGDTYTGDWEYWDGAAWSALSVTDNTDTAEPLDTTGVNSVHWAQPSDWDTTQVNGITCYWVRVELDGGGGTSPTQQNRNVYSIVWPYIETQSTAVVGDIEAIARHLFENEGYLPTLDGGYNRLVMGLRSYDRGDRFTAFINLSDEQNPSGYTVSAVAPGSFADDTQAPTGRRLQGTLAFNTTSNIGSVRLDSDVLADFTGIYHLYLRATSTNGNFEVLDFGPVEIPRYPGTQANTLIIDISIGTDDAGGTTDRLFDLIFIPVDEWAIDVTPPDETESGSQVASQLLDVDPVQDPARMFSLKRSTATGNPILYVYRSITPEKAILQANARQRLWCLFMQYDSTNSLYLSEPNIVNSVLVTAVQRYLGMRGNR
jgi:hypothetical protein